MEHLIAHLNQSLGGFTSTGITWALIQYFIHSVCLYLVLWALIQYITVVGRHLVFSCDQIIHSYDMLCSICSLSCSASSLLVHHETWLRKKLSRWLNFHFLLFVFNSVYFSLSSFLFLTSIFDHFVSDTCNSRTNDY